MPTSLYLEAQTVLGTSQKDLARRLGVSARTLSRWRGGRSGPGQAHYQALARLVAPSDAALAERLAAAGRSSLDALGAPVPKGPPPGPTVEHLVDSVLCAAAMAGESKPQDVRPAVLAAFVRAKALGLSIDDVAQALAPASARKKSG